MLPVLSCCCCFLVFPAEFNLPQVACYFLFAVISLVHCEISYLPFVSDIETKLYNSAVNFFTDTSLLRYQNTICIAFNFRYANNVSLTSQQWNRVIFYYDQGHLLPRSRYAEPNEAVCVSYQIADDDRHFLGSSSRGLSRISNTGS